MKDSIVAVQQDEFGNVEKKYTNTTGTRSRATKRPKTGAPVLEPDDSTDDSNFHSQGTSTGSDSASTEADQVSNSEVC